MDFVDGSVYSLVKIENSIFYEEKFTRLRFKIFIYKIEKVKNWGGATLDSPI